MIITAHPEHSCQLKKNYLQGVRAPDNVCFVLLLFFFFSFDKLIKNFTLIEKILFATLDRMHKILLSSSESCVLYNNNKYTFSKTVSKYLCCVIHISLISFTPPTAISGMQRGVFYMTSKSLSKITFWWFILSQNRLSILFYFTKIVATSFPTNEDNSEIISTTQKPTWTSAILLSADIDARHLSLRVRCKQIHVVAVKHWKNAVIMSLSQCLIYIVLKKKLSERSYHVLILVFHYYCSYICA